MRFTLAAALLPLISACAMPMPSVKIPPNIAATLTEQERSAITGNYAYAGEPESIVNLTPAFQASQFVSSQTVSAVGANSEIDTYENDTMGLMNVIAQCTVIYIDTDTDVVTFVNSYSTTYDSRYADHGC